MLAEKFSSNLILFEKVGNTSVCTLSGQSENIALDDAVEMVRKSDELDLIALKDLGNRDGGVSRGNPMVDAVKEFKSGYVLVILSLKNDGTILIRTCSGK